VVEWKKLAREMLPARLVATNNKIIKVLLHIHSQPDFFLLQSPMFRLLTYNNLRPDETGRGKWATIIGGFAFKMSSSRSLL
jgi:hypothetical protein